MEEKTAICLKYQKKGGALQSAQFVKEKIVIGRILSADLRIDDPRVSRLHALIEIKGEDIVITDLASTHGTYVNGKKIVEEKLKFGDVIKCGLVEIRIEKGSGVIEPSLVDFESQAVEDSEQTLLDIDRSIIDDLDRRTDGRDRRQYDVFPQERRLEERRKGDRRVDERSGLDRRKPVEPHVPPQLPEGVEFDRRSGEDRRKTMEFERRIGERRRGDRRVFDITSLERRIADRRKRVDDDILPEELEKAFVAPLHAQELEVTVLWGEHILEINNYSEPTILSVGENPRNTYIIPSVGIPDEFPLITIEDDGTAYLAFTEEMSGTVRARDELYSISNLTKAKFTKKYSNYYVIPLKKDDFAKLSIGTINFFILYVKPAPRILPPPWLEKDPLLIRSFIGSIILFILLMIGVSFIPKPKPVTIEMIPERFARIVIKKRPQLALKDTKTLEGGSVKGEGAKAKDEEGKSGKEDKKKEAQVIQPKKKTPQVVQRPKSRKIVDQKKAESVGLLKAFKQSGIQKDLKKLTDKNEGMEQFGKAVAGLRSQSLERVHGVGGYGLKGISVGGGGKTVGIDGPSTKGLGRGHGGEGIGEGIAGPGRLGVKGEHEVSVINENIQILSGLPKDVINAVVQRHRSEIRACYDASLQRNPSLRGKVTVSFTIQPNGIVSSASIKENTLGDPALGQCIISRVKTWIFPKPEAPVVTEVAAYPFYLSPAN